MHVYVRTYVPTHTQVPKELSLRPQGPVDEGPLGCQPSFHARCLQDQGLIQALGSGGARWGSGHLKAL